jgi:hypothetical protein
VSRVLLVGVERRRLVLGDGAARLGVGDDLSKDRERELVHGTVVRVGERDLVRARRLDDHAQDSTRVDRLPQERGEGAVTPDRPGVGNARQARRLRRIGEHDEDEVDTGLERGDDRVLEHADVGRVLLHLEPRHVVDDHAHEPRRDVRERHGDGNERQRWLIA